MTIEVRVRFPLAAAAHPGGYLANIIRVDQPADTPEVLVSGRRVDRSELRFAIYEGIALQVAHADPVRRWPMLVTIEHLNPTVQRSLLVLPRTRDTAAANIDPVRVAPGQAVELVLQADHDDLLIFEEGHSAVELAAAALQDDLSAQLLVGDEYATAAGKIAAPAALGEA